MDKAVEIIKALLELVAQGTFSVNTNGARQVSGLVNAAEQFVSEHEAQPDLSDELAEIESDVK